MWTLTFAVRAVCVKTEFVIGRRSYSRKSNLSTLAVSAGNKRFLTLGGWVLVVLVHCSTFSSKTIAVLAPKRKQKFVSRVYMQVYWSPFISIKHYVLPLSYARNEVLCCTEHLWLASSFRTHLSLWVWAWRGAWPLLMHDNVGKWNIDINKFQHSNAFWSATINIHAILYSTDMPYAP